MEDKLSHVDTDGNVRMVNVGEKAITKRIAVCGGNIKMMPQTVAAIMEGKTTKGNVLTTAKIAGIMAAKNTAQYIPMCHNIALANVEIDFCVNSDSIDVTATVEAEAKTGVEMEALTAVSAATLTIYDMAKAIDRGMIISNICLIKKSGGRTGDYIRSDK